MAKAFLRSFVAMRGWESTAERRIETEIWNNEKESELWDEIEESENLKFEFDSSHMFAKKQSIKFITKMGVLGKVWRKWQGIKPMRLRKREMLHRLVVCSGFWDLLINNVN
jgi:hypothetical protein